MDLAAPEAIGYEFQSHGVIEMLTKLNDKFIDERTTLEKEEANAKAAYKLMMQDLKGQIVQAVKDKHLKSVSKAKRLALKADENGDLKQETKLNLVDEKYLKDLKATCEMKAADFKARQELRTGEIQAIEKAIEIIANNVAGTAKKRLPSFVQKQALNQLRSSLGSQMQMRLASYLNARAQ